MNFEITERPTQQQRGPAMSALMRAVLDTATTGMAVKVALAEEVDYKRLRANLHVAAQRRGLSGHTTRQGNYVYAWVTRKNGDVQEARSLAAATPDGHTRSE